MTTTTHIHGPYQFEAHRAERDGRVYATFTIEDETGNAVHLYFHSREQAGELIAAGIAIEHVLAEGSMCGDIAEHTQRTCELPPGHEGQHRAGQVVWPSAGEAAGPEPELVPCGQGAPHWPHGRCPGVAAAPHCPICGSGLEPSGRCAVCTAIPRDVSGDLHAIPANRIGDAAPLRNLEPGDVVRVSRGSLHGLVRRRDDAAATA